MPFFDHCSNFSILQTRTNFYNCKKIGYALNNILYQHILPAVIGTTQVAAGGDIMKKDFLEAILNDRPGLQKHISFNQEFYCQLFNWYPAEFYNQIKKLRKLGILTQVDEYQSVSKNGKKYTVQKHIDYSYAFKYARCWSVDRQKLKDLIKNTSKNQNSFKNYSITIMGQGNNNGIGLINISNPVTTTCPHNGYINNLKTVPYYKDLLKLKSLWHNRNYEPQEVNEDIYKYLKKYKHLLSDLLPQGTWNFKFYTSRTKIHGEYLTYYFIHINRRLSDISFKTHNKDGTKNEQFNNFMKDNGLTTEFDYKASIHQSLFHLKQAEKHNKLKHFDIDQDIYTTLYSNPLFTRDEIKSCANRAVFCKSAIGAYNSVIKSGKEVYEKYLNGQTSFDWKEISAVKNGTTLLRLDKRVALAHINFIKSQIDDKYIMNLWNFESDRNERIKELLKQRGKKCFFNYDCFYTDATAKTAHDIAQIAHNETVLNWRKYKTEYGYFFYEKSE